MSTHVQRGKRSSVPVAPGATAPGSTTPGLGAARTRERPVRQLPPRRGSAHALLAGHRSVLIVEDNSWLGSVLADVLVSERYKVLQTTSPRTAARLAREYRPDVIVLDLELPNARGPDLLSDLKSGARTGTIPVLVLSSQPQLTAGDIRVAAYAVMRKPFGLAELLAQLNEAAALRAGSDSVA